MGLSRFKRPRGGAGGPSPHLFVANCGPAVGLSYDAIASVFGVYGEVKGVYPADESGTRVVVSYHDDSSSQDAMKALNGHPCSSLGGRFLHIQYSVQTTDKVNSIASVPVSNSASDLDIPGLHLFHEFVTVKEEQELLNAVDNRPWNHLAKRRVQHYGYKFCYDTRNVNTNHYLGKLPSFVSPILERIESIPMANHESDTFLDQLTVNEYPPGVGLSPHIDTHSAFEGFIFSLSLAGPCIMEFRKFATGIWQEQNNSFSEVEKSQINGTNSSFIRKAIYLPPRSMLLLSGEARYAWHHYIPHHKVDKVNESLIRRGPRRVSFTLRKVLRGPCRCEFSQCCDSQR